MRGGFGPSSDRRSGTPSGYLGLRSRTVLLVGVIPGREESAEVSKSNRSPKGNRMMRRDADPDSQRRGKVQGQRVRDRQPQNSGTVRSQKGHLGHRPSTLPAHLGDSASRGKLHRVRSPSEREGSAKACPEAASRPARPRLPGAGFRPCGGRPRPPVPLREERVLEDRADPEVRPTWPPMESAGWRESQDQNRISPVAS
jgi:hypothetical protein